MAYDATSDTFYGDDEGSSGMDPSYWSSILQDSFDTTGIGQDWLSSLGLKQSDVDSSSPAMSGDPLAGIPTGGFGDTIKSMVEKAGGSIKAAYDKDPGAFLRDFMKLGLGGIAQAYNNKSADERQQKVMDFQQKQIDDKIKRNNESITPYKGILETYMNKG